MNTLKIIFLSLMVILALLFYKESANTEEVQSSHQDVKAGEAVSVKSVSSAEITEVKGETTGIIVKTDPESIDKGMGLFDLKCSFCHNAFDTGTIIGPGLKGVLKNPKLPVSKKPATPENIANQLKRPYRDMPSFEYLPEGDVLNIIAYLNTL